MVQSREVKTAGELGEYTDVIEGLEGGETLVVKGNEGLQENQPVEVRGEDKRNQPNP